MSTALHQQAQRLINWVKFDAIPLWRPIGFSPAGLHYDRLLADGTVDMEADFRLRVQARQAFFYSVAAYKGWSGADAALTAQNLLKSVKHLAGHPSGCGYVHQLNHQLTVVDKTQDLYDHSFFLLAHAWDYRATANENALVDAEALIEYLDAQFVSDHGGWNEGDYAYSYRRQNPHMHLLEAFLALYDATGAEKWLARASTIIDLFKTHFFKPDLAVLFEFFGEQWQQGFDEVSLIVEPGHMMEWVWLLDWYSQRSGESLEGYIHALYNKGLSIGVSPSGLVYAAVAPSGRVIDANKRCWCVTELIKASLVMMRHGHPRAEAMAVQSVNALFGYYLCASTPGAYIDQRGPNDEIVVDYAPASTLYHIIGAALELDNYLKR